MYFKGESSNHKVIDEATNAKIITGKVTFFIALMSSWFYENSVSSTAFYFAL